MINKIRVGVVAVSAAAGAYFYNQEGQLAERAVEEAPSVAAPAMEMPEGESLPQVVDGVPAPIGLPRMNAPGPASEAVAQPDPLLQLESRTLMSDLSDESAGGTAPEPIVTAPGPSEIAEAAPRLPGGKDLVRVYYGTNRKPDRSVKPDSDPADYYGADLGPLEFGIVEVSVPKVHERGTLERPRWYLLEKENATKHFVLQRVVPTNESLFLRELNRDIAADPKREAFIFVHGFGTSFEAAAWRTGQLKADLEFPGPAIMYSWPSKGSISPIAYFQDRDTVRDSRDELMQFLETVGTQTGATKIHVIAHSMGNYLLAPSLALLKERSYLPHPMFDQLVLAAPDISAELFLNEIAPKLDRSARRTTIYAADNDYALRVSQMFNRSLRLGTLLGIRKAPAFPFIEVVDTAGAEFRLFEVGHSDYGGPVLNDLKSTIRGLKPNERGLAQHHIVPVHWEVPSSRSLASTPSLQSTIVQVNHNEVIPGTLSSAQPVKQKAGLWSRLTSWWPW